MASYFIGVDVGTGSARAGVFDLNGRMVGRASRAIDLYRPKADFVEQSSDNIWQAVCNAVRDAVNRADINPIQVKGLGFDATCSLVVLDKEGKPLTVSPSGRTEQNIIVWMDHRAIARAERINATKHRVLDFVGGIISPEMQTPKLLWLKQHMPTTGQRRLPVRSAGLPHGAPPRRHPFAVLDGVQVDLSRPRTALGQELLPADRAGRRAGT